MLVRVTGSSRMAWAFGLEVDHAHFSTDISSFSPTLQVGQVQLIRIARLSDDLLLSPAYSIHTVRILVDRVVMAANS